MGEYGCCSGSSRCFLEVRTQLHTQPLSRGTQGDRRYKREVPGLVGEPLCPARSAEDAGEISAQPPRFLTFGRNDGKHGGSREGYGRGHRSEESRVGKGGRSRWSPD